MSVKFSLLSLLGHVLWSGYFGNRIGIHIECFCFQNASKDAR